MSNATSFTPDEPLAVLQAERGIIAAICLAWGAWGVVLALTVQCISVLSRNLKRTWNKFLIFYVFAIFSLCTIAESTHLKWLQMLFVDDRAIPGGPLAYDKQFYASAINVSGTTCDFIINYLSDLLLLYRLFLIYERKFLIILLPSMIFLTQLGLSVVDLITLSQPGNNMFTHSAINFGLLYWSFSVSFNVLVTSLIVGRLLYHRNRILSVVGGNHGKLYITLSSVLIESSALYTIAALIFLGGYASQTPVQFAGEVAEIIQGIAPLLIILRVANGKAYDETTLAISTQVHAARRASHSGPVFAPRIQMEADHSIDTPGDSTAQDYAMDSMQHIVFNKDEGNKGDKAWIQ